MKLFINELKRSFKNKKDAFLRFVLVGVFNFIFFGGAFITTLSLEGSYNRAISPLEIDVYLEEGLNDFERTRIDSILNVLAGVMRIEYINRVRAKKIFKSVYPEYAQLLDLFPESPLPECYRLYISTSFARSQWIEGLLERIKLIPGVEDVYFPLDTFRRTERLFRRALFSSLFLLLLTLAALFVSLYHLMNLTIREDKKRNEVLKLLGVSPFVIKSLYSSLGAIWSLIASIFALFPLYYIFYKLNPLRLQSELLYLPVITGLAFILGVISGYAASES